ncbi:MAG TPA: HEAT repeat domain-containing protein [Opitutaceae bacterium]
MPGWLHASEAAPLLDGLILISCLLAGTAFVVWAGCFAYHSIRLNRLDREAALEARLTDELLQALADDKAKGSFFSGRPAEEHTILMDVLLQLLDQTRGRDHERMISLLHDAGALESALDKLEHSRRPSQRLQAAQLLGYFREPKALLGLHRALGDRDLAVRLIAARTLLAHDAIPSLRELLGKLALSESDPPLTLADIFQRLPADVRPEAVALLSDGTIPVAWKRMLAIALGRNRAQEAFEPLCALAEAPAPRLRAAAWVALRDLGDPHAAALLPRGFCDPVADVRVVACRCAAVVGGPESIPLLVGLLQDEDWWVRYHAASALCDLGPEGQAALETVTARAAPDDVGTLVCRERRQEVPHGA